MKPSLDSIDRRILAALQRDASLSSVQLADDVGISQGPCWRRIRRLESEGIIKQRVALLDRRKLGLNVMIFAHVKLEDYERFFRDHLSQLPAVRETISSIALSEIKSTLELPLNLL